MFSLDSIVYINFLKIIYKFVTIKKILNYLECKIEYSNTKVIFLCETNERNIEN